MHSHSSRLLQECFHHSLLLTYLVLALLTYLTNQSLDVDVDVLNQSPGVLNKVRQGMNAFTQYREYLLKNRI
jgi:hypothetical protein